MKSVVEEDKGKKVDKEKVKENIKILLSNPDDIKSLAKSIWNDVAENEDSFIKHDDVCCIFKFLCKKLRIKEPSDDEMGEMLNLIHSKDKPVIFSEFPFYIKVLLQIITHLIDAHMTR